MGDPINAVKIFNEKEADELIVLDIDATANNAEPDYKMIANMAAESRMPLCYGGGVRTPEQAKRIIGLGVEKVAISSAAIKNSDLISRIAEEIGRQSVVIVIDVKKRLFSKDFDVWINNGKENTKLNALEFAVRAAELGAGEIVINSIDNDGKMKGYDVAFAARLREAVKIPITILGGAGSLDDMRELFIKCGIVGAAAGSLFVFKGVYKAVLINYPNPQEKDALIHV